MALILREADVQRLLPMAAAISAVEAAFRAVAAGEATNLARRRALAPGGALNVMAAALPSAGVMGVKSYTAFASAGARHVFLLYSASDGALLAIIEADWLGRIRTGAASGLATRLLARPDVEVLAMIGTGGQAWPQVEAVCCVRPIKSVRVYGRNEGRRARFAEDIRTRLCIEATAADSAEGAVDGADVVTTMKTAATPVVQGRWLAPGAHVNAAGSNWPDRREVDEETVTRSTIVAVDSRDAAALEAGDLIYPASRGHLDWEGVYEISDLVGGDVPARGADDLTLFKSVGLALEDVAVAAHVYRAALDHGAGERLNIAGAG